jgi:hypothetical protein
MTIERLALGAHQADAAAGAAIWSVGCATPRRVGDQPFQRRLKVRLPRHRLVVGNAVAIKLRASRAAAERGAVRQVIHLRLRQERRQIVGGKPRTKPRYRRRAHVGDGAGARRAQHRHKALRRNIGVTDAVKIERRHGGMTRLKAKRQSGAYLPHRDHSKNRCGVPLYKFPRRCNHLPV